VNKMTKIYGYIRASIVEKVRQVRNERQRS
jgi:hypothetical protein